VIAKVMGKYPNTQIPGSYIQNIKQPTFTSSIKCILPSESGIFYGRYRQL